MNNKYIYIYRGTKKMYTHFKRCYLSTRYYFSKFN